MSLFFSSFKPKYHIWKYTTKLLCFLLYTLIKPTLWYVCWCIRFLSSTGNNFIALHSSPFPFFIYLYFKNENIQKTFSQFFFITFFFRYNAQLNTIDHGIIKHFHGKLIQKIIPNKLSISYWVYIRNFVYFLYFSFWLPDLTSLMLLFKLST